MDVYNSEEQQVEAIKSWWKENGKSIIAGLVIGFVGLFGWRYYNDYVRGQREASAAEFQTIQSAISADHEKAFDKATAFIDAHKKDVYADLAGLMLASEAVKVKQYDLAATQLKRIATDSKDDELKTVAGLRLARVLIEQSKAEEALSVLGTINSESYKAMVAEIKGDAFFALKKTEEARKAYESALQLSANNTNPVLQMKLDDLAVAK